MALWLASRLQHQPGSAWCSYGVPSQQPRHQSGSHLKANSDSLETAMTCATLCTELNSKNINKKKSWFHRIPCPVTYVLWRRIPSAKSSAGKGSCEFNVKDFSRSRTSRCQHSVLASHKSGDTDQAWWIRMATGRSSSGPWEAENKQQAFPYPSGQPKVLSLATLRDILTTKYLHLYVMYGK